MTIGAVVGIIFHTVVFCLVEANSVPPSNSSPMRVMNHAGAPIELFWVDTITNDGSLVKQTEKPIRNATDTHIDSYDTHKFLVRFLKQIKGAEATFTKGPREETIFVTYDPESNNMSVKQTTKFSEVLDTVKNATSSCSDLTGEHLVSCIASGIMGDIEQLTDSKAQLKKYRDLISGRLRDYTCADPYMKSSEPIRSYQQTVQNKPYTLDVMLDTEHAKLWTIDNFITREECDILMQHGRPRLTRATVAAEDGTSVISNSRKAQQAQYNLNKMKPESDPLWPLYNRVLEITNRHTGMNLKPPGQEDFVNIQYNVADQYTPHCDGACDHAIHIPTGRVATAVMYCKVAEEGGGTSFTKADLFVKPVNNSATFFSYMSSKDMRMDDGYTEHSGCPVTKGEKWITVAWMREGVDAEHPWEQYDPNGVKLMDLDLE